MKCKYNLRVNNDKVKWRDRKQRFFKQFKKELDHGIMWRVYFSKPKSKRPHWFYVSYTYLLWLE